MSNKGISSEAENEGNILFINDIGNTINNSLQQNNSTHYLSKRNTINESSEEQTNIRLNNNNEERINVFFNNT